MPDNPFYGIKKAKTKYLEKVRRKSTPKTHFHAIKFGAWLRAFREREGFDLKTLAFKFEISPNTLSKIEKRKKILGQDDLALIHGMARMMNVSPVLLATFAASDRVVVNDDYKSRSAKDGLHFRSKKKRVA